MIEYDQIKAAVVPIFQEAGIDCVKEEYHPDVFGSAYSEYKGKGQHYRVIWDGKDGRGYVQCMASSGWEDLHTTIPESDNNIFSETLLKISSELKVMVASK